VLCRVRVGGVDRFEDLIAWQLADALRRDVFTCTDSGKAAKDFKYRDQIRDASSSAARNTAEGFGRFNPGEFARFLDFARASLNETQDCLLDGHSRKYLDQTQFDRMWSLSRRALAANAGLMRYLKECAAKGKQPWTRKRRVTDTPTGSLHPKEPANPEPSNPRTVEPSNDYDRPVHPNPYSADLAGRDPLEALGDTPSRIHALTRQWTPAQFERTYAPGKWTARQILIHLAQTEMALGARARMALCTTPYTSQPFDQNAWMTRDAAISSVVALNALVAMSAMNLALFASLSEADRATAFTHPEYGSISVDWLIHQMAGHQIHHLKHFEVIAAL
jgi:four helix bundle protein